MFGLNFNLTEEQKGYASLIIGVILLLHSFGWFSKWLSGIVMFYAIFLIVYGVLKTQVVKKTIACVMKNNKKPPTE